MAHDLNAVFYADSYHPIQAGSIDGTDTTPHDNAVYRAMLATSTGLYDPIGDSKAQGNPHCIVFVGRLARETTEATIEEVMSKFGKIKTIRLVRHIVTGASQGYAFVEYETIKEMRRAYEAAHQIRIDGRPVLVDYNRQLLMPGWIPRRLGGGLGGRKESGQLRFGGRDRPFRKPLRPIPQEELEKLGIPLPGRYTSRFETPPLPKRISDLCNKRTSSQHDDKEMSHHSYASTKREKTIEKVTLEEHDSERWHTQSHARGSDTYSEVDKKWHHKRHERKEEGDKGHHHHHHRSDKYQHEEDNRWGYSSHASKKSSHKEAYEEDALERCEKRKDYQTSEEMRYDHSSEKDTVMHEEDDKEDQLERHGKKRDRHKGDDMKHHHKKHDKRREHRSDKREPEESVYLDKGDEQEEDKTAAYEKHGRKKDHHRKDDRKHKHNWDGSQDYEKDEPSEHEYSHQEDAVTEGVSHSNRQHKRRRSSRVNKSSSEDDHFEQDAKRKKEEGLVKRHRSR